ncbi:hypothetical protein NFI96_030521, partial [Prochilodus magdalenae]
TVRQVTDKDAVKQKLTVVVEDNGQPSRSAVVNINHHRSSTMQLKWQAVFFFLCVYGMDVVFGQARYSIPEEMPEGSFVGNIAKDLGIEISRLVSGKARVVTKGGRQYVELSRDKGALVVKERIDREELCKQTTPCSFSFDLIIENPIQLHRITVEVQDINDNAPVFPKSTVNMKISENTASGTRFPLNRAVDTDVGVNGIQSYVLSPTDNFKLEINNRADGQKYVEMVLQHELDREKHEQLTLVLTAYDGGSPKKSSAVQIHITVLDANDNTPVCKQLVYKAEVRENSPVGTVLTTVSAADADEGMNGMVSYSFAQASVEAIHVFEINSETGDITLLNQLDYETERSYQVDIKAMDNGGLADTCKVIIDVIDENDNSPTIQLMSFSNTIAESSPVGTTVAVINVEDADSGQNGVVQCKINTDIPFKIESSISDYYALITDEILDRENTAEYNITILVSDQGSPALHSNKTLTVKISDVNDNAPVFDSDQYRAFITENNSPGVAVLTVKARDADWGPNARLSYFLEDSDVMGNPVSSLMSINSDSGVINAVRSFDYEQMKSFSFNVTARDGGSPPLSSEVMVTVTVQDQNDNAPQVLYPVQTGGSLVAEIVPRSADVGYLVTKVVAVDVDSGQNAWLSYKLQRATDRALFEVGPQNGEIRTVRQVTDKDAVKQKLTVVVEDNGQPSRSAVVNINVAVADSFPEVVSEFSDFTHSREYNDNLTFYLVLALAAVSFLFITTVVVIISVKIYRWRQSRIFYQSNLPVIPYYPPGYADTGVTGTLPHMYNYDVCMTTNSRKSDCKYSTLGGQSVLVVDQSFSETLQRAMKEKEFLENAESPEEDNVAICMDYVGSRIFSLDRRSSTMQLKWQTVFFFLCVYGMDIVFGQARYSIPEEMPEGSFVGNIAKDLGIEISRLVSGKARVVTKGGRQYVELSRDKGALVVKERIDREELCKQTTPCSFSFDLIIENPIQLHRITVEVQDINDNAPVFPKSTVNMKISESTGSGTRFPLDSAVDLDVGINGIQSYALNPTDNFKLEINNQPDGETNVEMVLQHELDREHRDELKLVLTAYDGGSPKKSSTVQIHIKVLDVNDNTPVCKQSVYKAEVRENSPVGTVLTTVSAADADEGINGQVSYSFAQASKEARNLFGINSETGSITTLDRLDYETQKSYNLNIKAMDNGGLADTCKVIIDVMDENDNPPTIQLMSFSNTIAESSPVGTTVAVINVEDADSGQNGVVQCKINTDIPFKIESSISDYYALITDEILDRENTAEYNITILVSDQGSPALHSNKTLTVKISDVNDNAPVFDSEQYRAFITENNSPGVAVLTVKARDADWGPNARLSYFLEDSDVMGNPVSSLMSINSDSGVINAVRSFDYEQMKSFSFNVTARDGGSPPLSSEVMVTVTVQDQNDNAPQVLYPVQTGGSLVAEIVPRSADVGYLVTKVVAVDVDSGQNAWLSYKLQRATDRALFEVGPQNGEIRTVRQVTDKDAVKQKLTVVVEDNGQPSRSAVVNINVAVADSFPEVVSEFSDFTHSREYNDNLTFYLVLALAAVSFLFITTVVVIISVKIYRWRQSRIFYQSNLPVIPYYPPGYADTGVTGTLPHMYNYDVCMTTNSRKSDCKYSTLGGQSVLVVDQSLSETLQRAMKEKEFLENAESPEEDNTIQPTNDIVFGQARYSIPEEMPEGSFVGNIAKDLGIEISRLVSGKARVVTKGGRQYVELSRDKGALVVKERIDREELCKQTTPCSFSFDLIIENPIQLHRITVEVQDINDNAPIFPKGDVSLEISENTVSGARFPLDSAVDTDVGINGIQSYSLSPTDNFKLEINSQPDGTKHVEMVLQRELDREERDELKLVLIASDGGSPRKSGTVRIHVTVLDVNDNAPVCNQAVYKIDVKENSPVGSVLATVSAADADEGINGQISYSIAQASKEARALFDINSETGDIKNIGGLDYENERSYIINIKAKDKGGLANTCKVIIDVMDENDNAPTVQLMSFSNTIAESSPVGTTVAVINVEDADSGQNGVVQCKINTDIPFKIESSISDYYALITDEILDRENTAEYNITILVSDQGSPALHSNKTLTVKISDVNDNAPVFDSDQYRTFITENNSPGVAVLTVKASDADFGPNARLSYFLEDSDVMGNPVSSLMSINSDSGVIHAVRSFDYEQMKSFSFNVTARDGGSPPLSSEVMVTVTVQDQNDNAPQVLYPVQTGVSLVAEIVPRSADVGYLVTKVVAVDVDSGQNAWLSYKLQRATDRALFEVGPQNGEIRTVRQVTDKDAVKQKLTVVVEDNGQPSRSAVVNINVAVADSFPEVVSEFSDFTHSREYNDNLTFYLVLALAAVSFLFITTVVVIISVKIYRWRQSRIFYQSNLPVIPYYPPGYTDTGVTGTLPHMYNYDVCMTTNSRKSDCKYSTLGGQSVLVMDQSLSETLQRAMKEKEFLENAESPEEHRQKSTMQLKWQTAFFFLCVYGMDVVFGQARYSIPEEMPEGSFVGNIAKDLGIEISRLVSGKARVVTKGGRQYVELSRDKGALVVKERIDREELCKQTTPCSFSFDLIIENPIQLHRITVEVQDINDNAPIFPKDTVNLQISENTGSGKRFPLDGAVDLDVGINGIQSYALSPTDHFKLEINNQPDGKQYVEMVLQRELDREERDKLKLIITAYDGGSPKRSSTAQIHITVLDINDNTPVCQLSVYKAEVREDSPVGTVITTVNAVDADEGINGEISYSFAQASKEARNLFEIHPETGAVTSLNQLDFETEKHYELNIEAKDKGGLADTCKVIIDVIDENDNPPTIQLMSFSNTIAESSPVGTTVAVINVEDADSGQNGVVQCKINTDIPFKIESSISDYYALITDEILDRENTAEYNITILVSDQGSPALHSNKILTVKISDVNDNAPVFDSDQYRTFITENNSPGVAVLTVKARDADWGPNARLSYFVEDSDVMGNPVSSLMSINSDSGVIHAVRSFDYEQMKSFSFNVTARDGGSPPLSSEVMVTVTVQDQNDNAPQVLYPVQTGGSLVAEIVPRSADVGYLVTKVVAVDVDSGQNAWLSYKLQRATDRALFEVGPQNGEIRTVRQVTDKDAVKQKLTVVVEDNGQPSRSAVVNINVAVADSFPEVVSEFSDFTHSREYNDNLTFYLVLALAAVSFLFITTVVVIISVKIYRWRQSRIFYQSNLPVIPYYPPGYADTGVTGTLPHMYNYDVCMTTNSRKSDCKYSTLGGRSVLVVDQSFSETLQRAMKEKEFLGNAESPEEASKPA